MSFFFEKYFIKTIGEIMKFTDLNLPEYIIRALEKNMITDPTTVQERAIPMM